MPAADDGKKPSKDRKQMMFLLKPTLIARIKIQAIREDRHAYEVVEEILDRYIKPE